MKQVMSYALFILCAGSFLVYLSWLNQETQWSEKIRSADVVFPDGAKYYGETWNKLLHGRGKLVWAEGSIYEGEFYQGLLQGQGRYRDADGTLYQGEYFQGLRHGVGELVLVDGSIYSGQFENNTMQGSGKFVFTNGDIYIGEFKKNVFSGQGSYTAHTNIVYTGTFVKGEILAGMSVDAEGNIYQGEFKNWLYHGEGNYNSEDGRVYAGDFNAGALSGRGTAEMADGSFYQGEFSAWAYSGLGKLTEENGDVYEGAFSYGSYHGPGTLYLKEAVDDVREITGEWSYGQIDKDPRKTHKDHGPLVEKALYSQSALLDKELNKFSDNLNALSKNTDPNKIDMYFLGVAGYGKQDVFLKEINSIQALFNSERYSENRSFTLINHWQSAEHTPLATLTSLERSITAISDLMDLNRDILFLYMTSHGSEDHRFSLQLKGLSLPDISAENLAALLNSSPVKWKVIVISACYSGGYIHLLENDNSLIITAAREDRKSFGCSDDSDMTYFAKAFFKEALSRSDSFVSAFEKAKELIYEWEDSDFPDSEHSEPQLFMGAKIEGHLRKWRRQFSPSDHGSQAEKPND